MLLSVGEERMIDGSCSGGSITSRVVQMDSSEEFSSGITFIIY